MTDEKEKRWRKVKEILNQALKLDDVERRTFLQQACGQDESVMREVESLISCDGKADDAGFLHQNSPDKTRSLLSEVDQRLRDDQPSETDGSQELPIPKHIERYEVKQQIGAGAFGIVVLANDPKLDRQVAIKLQKYKRPSSVSSLDFEREARILAKLDHANIVPVYDSGQLEDGRSYVVSKFVEGQDLAAQIDEREFSTFAIAQLVASIAEALQHAHSKRLIHRDVKPSNILLDDNGMAYLTDFGLTLSDEEFGDASSQGYTPAYASPEQAAGEGHRVDGRSDIFSLGVVFYQLLTGERPFSGGSSRELLERIRMFTPRPPRQLDPSIPEELERICLRALAQQKCDRYTTAHDMASDLRYFLSHVTSTSHLQTNRLDFDSSVEIVPKGLRSFGPEDASYFLQLLPGPRNREGLPESVAFWKKWVETTEADPAHRVGLVYGPSGCGKSSFIKAGLIPRLADHVDVIYVESVPVGTEDRVIRQLLDRFEFEPITRLVDMLRSLRRRTTGKVLLVLDQFEQWLHTTHHQETAELVQALRQCDGQRIQCIVIVRDDLWMAVSRFMRVLDIQIQEGRNTAGIELFRPSHARYILSEFGRANGDLPKTEPLTPLQEQFLSSAVRELQENDRISCVHLVLFSQMVRGKTWTPKALQRAGGAAGLGTEFLEETFNGRSSPLGYRQHQNAIRAVLAALLPDSLLDVKGRALAVNELRNKAAYEGRPQAFAELLDILDSQTRLITPAESPSDTEGDSRCYQLTHDHLVPSIRDWLTRKQKETRRGRAELCLRERANQFKRVSSSRYLPSPIEFVSIQAFVPHRKRNAEEKSMMAAASKHYGIVSSLLLLTAFLLYACVWEFKGHNKAEGLVESIASTDISELPRLVEQLPRYRRWVQDDLLSLATDESNNRKQRLNASLAVLSMNSQDDLLAHPLLPRCTLSEFPVVRDSLRPYKEDLSDALWKELRHGTDSFSRLLAGMALASYEPDRGDWTEDDALFLATQLVESPPKDQHAIRESLRPIGGRLSKPLQAAFRSLTSGETKKNSAAYAIADFSQDDPLLLIRLAMFATPEQFKILYSAVSSESAGRDEVVAFLRSVAGEQPTPDLTEQQRVLLGKRRAGAAIFLLRLGLVDDVLNAFTFVDDPESLTQFIHQYRARGVTIHELIRCLNTAERLKHHYARLAMLLAMGEFAVSEVDQTTRTSLIDRLKETYANDDSSAIHATVGWLLRQWGASDDVDRVDKTPIPYDTTGKREWFVQQAADDYFTMVVFRSGEFTLGSDEREAGRRDGEKRTSVRFSRAYAMTDREVTLEQYSRYIKPPRFPFDDPPRPDYPMSGASWIDAVRYCGIITGKAQRLTKKDQCYAAVADMKKMKNPPSPVDWPYDLTKRGFRLPTEAEWEHACRAGMSTAFGFGNDRDLLEHYGWFLMNADARPHRVVQLRPNLRGLFDMHGNAFEWCNCWNSIDAPSGVDPTGPAEGKYRSIRGGGWSTYVRGCRAGSRLGYLPTLRAAQYGFRMVMTLPDQN